jgi:1,4-alpha-glucan branching enzyme
MGWMHDTLRYFSKEPIHRKHHHSDLTFRLVYAFNENFVLPLSHDEVVHGKGSLLGRMPGDEWQKFANLRLLYGLMYGQPGKKLLFMGAELGQYCEWNHESSLDWHLLRYAPHEGLRRWLSDLNRVYRDFPALHLRDCDGSGFSWVDCNDAETSALTFLRHGDRPEDDVLIVCNFTPVPRTNYRVGVPRGGMWRELLNSDLHIYGGGGWQNLGGVEASPVGYHGRPYSLMLSLPALSAVYLKCEGEQP